MTSPAKTFKIKEPNAPASEAQIKFLKSLLDTREPNQETARAEFAFATNTMTKGLASEFITAIKAQPWKAKSHDKDAATMVQIPGTSITVPAPVTTPVTTPVAVSSQPVPEYGYYLNSTPYQNEQGETLYYWDKAKNAWAPKIKKLVFTTTYSGAKKAKWINMGGTFQAKKLLAGKTPLSYDEAGKLGKQYGVCIRCAAILTDPVSVAKGVGPICAGYWGM